MPVSHCEFCFLRCDILGKTVAVLHGLGFVTATNDASVCALGRIMWTCHPQHSQAQFPSALPLNFKSLRAVQQRYNSSSSGTTPANLGTLTYMGTPVFPPFQLAIPPGFQAIHIPKGNLVLPCVKLSSFTEYFVHFFSLSVAFLFSRALGCGARRGVACTPRCKCGSRRGSVARALSLQRREIWQETTGSLSDEPSPIRLMENPEQGELVLL